MDFPPSSSSVTSRPHQIIALANSTRTGFVVSRYMTKPTINTASGISMLMIHSSMFGSGSFGLLCLLPCLECFNLSSLCPDYLQVIQLLRADVSQGDVSILELILKAQSCENSVTIFTGRYIAAHCSLF